MDNLHLLTAFSQAASDNALDRAFSNETSGCNPESSTVGNSALFVLGMLPIVTLFLGTIGNHVVSVMSSSLSFCSGSNVVTKMDYVLFDLIPILSMVETPVLGGAGSEKYGLLDDRDESPKGSAKSTTSSPKDYYVTSGIRSTYRHLQSEAGDLSIFRGIGLDLIKVTMYSILVPIFEWVLKAPGEWLHASRFLPQISLTIAFILFQQIDMAWTHIIISKPQHKFWFRRLPLTFFSSVNYLWIPCLAMSVVYDFAAWVPSLWAAELSAKTDLANGDKIQLYHGPAIPISFSYAFWPLTRILLGSFVAPVLRAVLATPVEAAVRRMQASLLPDDDDPIVSMDRSFNGRPTSGILARTEPLDFKRACRSIDRPTYIRLAKLNLKVRLLKNAVMLVFLAIVGLELAALVGFSTSHIFLKMALGVPIKLKEVEGIHGLPRDILNKITVEPQYPDILSMIDWDALKNRMAA